jgi:hypothetical protein
MWNRRARKRRRKARSQEKFAIRERERCDSCGSDGPVEHRRVRWADGTVPLCRSCSARLARESPDAVAEAGEADAAPDDEAPEPPADDPPEPSPAASVAEAALGRNRIGAVSA